MRREWKIVIAIGVTCLVVAGWYYGAYLPVVKSHAYISGRRSLSASQQKSLNDFFGFFAPALDMSSPIGGDELVYAYLEIVMNVASQQQNPAVVDALVKDAEKRAAPIIERGSGFDFSQTLYEMGSLYRIAAVKLRSEAYYEKAIALFKKGLAYSPNREMFLAGLFDLYQMKQDVSGMRETGRIILRYWPNDSVGTAVARILETIEASSKTSTSAPKAH